MRKDFKNLDIYAAFQPANGAEWQKANGISADWKTPEHIEVMRMEFITSPIMSATLFLKASAHLPVVPQGYLP